MVSMYRLRREYLREKRVLLGTCLSAGLEIRVEVKVCN
jgi:hypothetical protein